MSRRTTPATVLTMPTPTVADGRPGVSAHVVEIDSDVTLIQGPTHIHAIPDPNPIWDPRTSGWFHPPPNNFGGRWTVDDLPDPSHYAQGWYWLGDPTAADGTAGIQPRAHQWAPNGSTPHAPSWHSHFPFKPSVRSHDSYLPGGSVVHHPRGVHFNSHFIEHMWADFGSAHRQPFTWVMAAIIVNYPSTHYTHHLLDAGRNPDSVGFPRISAEQCNQTRAINDGLAYRTVLAVSPSVQSLSASQGTTPPTVRSRANAAQRPKMFFGVYNGVSSLTGAYDTGARYRQAGHISNSTLQQHRYYVLGRGRGVIGQNFASHILVFEIRYWRAALSTAQLDAEYAQLSSTYQFDRYRALR